MIPLLFTAYVAIKGNVMTIKKTIQSYLILMRLILYKNNMKSHFNILCLLLFFISSNENLSAQNFSIRKKTEHIKVMKDTSFVKEVTVLIKKNVDLTLFPIFYDYELENLSNIKVYTKKNKRYKLQKHNTIYVEEIQNTSFTSKKVKMVLIPANRETKITYTTTCKELMYFSSLPFFTNYSIDTLNYQISVPSDFRFIHKTTHKDSLNYLVIDSVKTNTSTKWNIALTPTKVKTNEFIDFGIYRDMKEPLMRTLVIPANYEGKEAKYMNDWYLDKVSKRRELDQKPKDKIDELTQGITSEKEIINILYNYVKDNFKYVAIEIGMGAFIPSHVNDVFMQKQGDCKDLSNFLSEALKYKGVKSDIAIAATYDHISDCDFPSLSSANHLICIAYLNNNPIILDPTDPIHIEETPVQSIQQRTILIFNSEGGKFYNAPIFNTDQNLVNYKINLNSNLKETILQGSFQVIYNGISGNFLKREFNYVGSNKTVSTGVNYYESLFGDQNITDLTINNNSQSLNIEGKLSINDKIIKDGDYRFLFIDFLPNIFETENRESLLEGTNIGSAFHKKIELEVNLEETINTFEPIIHKLSDNDISLTLIISSPSEHKINCSYDFVFNHIFIDKNNIESANKMIKSFKKIINAPITFTKKSE